MSKRITLIAPLGTPDRRVRLFKSVNVMKNLADCDIHFWGWQREKEEALGANWDLLSTQRAILKGGGYRSKAAHILYIAWALSVFFNVLFRGPKRIYCLGLETAAPVWAATRIRRGSKYVFDDADRLVMVWSLPGPIDRLFRWLEVKASKASVAHIVPVKELYDFETDKMHLVYNMPTSEQVEQAQKIELPPKRDGLVVYVNGTLNETRNMGAIEKAAEILANDSESKVSFKLATPKRIDGADHMETLSNVENLGWLPQDVALAHYRNSDVVLTMFDIRANGSYKYAWPNKWGDAFCMGTPIIVNDDSVSAAPFLKSGVALHCPFGDAQAMVDLLKDLSENPSKLDVSRNAIEVAKENYLVFDAAVTPALNLLLA